MKSRFNKIVLIISATLIVGLLAIMGYGLWRGLTAIRDFPMATANAMQPILESIYRHHSETGAWPENLDDVGLKKVAMPHLATPSFEIVDHSTAMVRVHGPGHQFMRFTFSADVTQRKSSWTLNAEGGGGEIQCPTQPW